MAPSESGSASIRSGTTGSMSETSSQRSDSRMLRKLKRSADEREEGDLLEQQRSFQEGVFSCMYTLVRQTALSSWKFAVIKIVLEGLMPFIVVFNPSLEWDINTKNPVWQVVRWAVWRSPIMRLYGYDTYIRVMYVMAIAVLLAVAGLVWLTIVMRKQEQSKWLRTAAMWLHVAYDLIFMMFYVSFFDYFVFAANCRFTDKVKTHEYFTDVDCLAMPHVLHMSVALTAALVQFCVTALMLVASCDLNPVSGGYLASPDAYSRLKILVAKAALIIAADAMQAWPKPQVLCMNLAAALICWWNFRKIPFYRLPINAVWCGMWFAVLYTTGVLTALVFGNDHSTARRQEYTMYILYGVFPAMAVGMALCTAHAWWTMRPAKRFQELTSFRNARLQKAYKFSQLHEVEVLSRVMRRFDADGVVVEDAASHGEAVIKAGMAAFPNSPFLYILYANYLLEVRRDAPAARTQLQLALKHGPTLVERYQIYCTGESSKRLTDSLAGGMDLQAYIEFRRNFRAVLRVHKEVLLLEMELWRLCLRTRLHVASIDATLDDLEAATNRAHQVYKRVLERYPTNGKLLRCYGKFLEDVQHDPAAATRAYVEAARNGGADAIMSLDLSAVQQANHKPEFLTSLSLLDDAVVIIDAEGSIMMVSQAVQTMFGYTKAELEGANVSLLMPQPFSQRHPSYMSRYLATGEARILDIVREVVALHKDRYVFPIQLCVTKMSGSGTDSVFLGVLRPLPPNSQRIRAWLAPNGTFLCGDQQFASLCGLAEKDLVGRSLASLVASSDAEATALLERFRASSEGELQAGLVKFDLLLRHRYLDPVPVEATLGLAGTDEQRILSLSCRRTDGREGSILVVDAHMRLHFASLGVSALLNYPMRRLAAMRLDQLLPPPYNTLHAKWLRDPPRTPAPTSCRCGKVVHLLNEAGSPVPVRVQVHAAAGNDVGSTLYVVQVEKVPAEELFEEKRLVISADLAGRVQAVSQPSASLFGFPAAHLVGTSLCDSVDIFEEWRRRNGDGQMQLLVLALVDREQEMPGTSWRVRVHAPKPQGPDGADDADSALPPLMGLAPSMRRKPAGPSAISACLQIELVTTDGADGYMPAASSGLEDYDGGDFLGRLIRDAAVDDGAGLPRGAGGGRDTAEARIRLTLWRRDLLTGVVELDDQMLVRRASPLAGLIVGLPSTAMLKQPLRRFLDLPSHKSWGAIAAAASQSHHSKRSAMKSTYDRGAVSPVMAFVGPHPDMGTMRIAVQGVQTLAPGGRSKVTAVLHPDTNFVGAHANLLRVLHLEDVAALESAAAAVAVGVEGEGDEAAAGKVAGAGQEAQQATQEQRESGSGVSADGRRRRAARRQQRRRRSSGVEGPDGVASEGLVSESAGEGASGSDSADDSDSGADAGGMAGTRRQANAGAEDPDARGEALLHRSASSRSDFVAQWVRTVSKRMLAGASAQSLSLEPASQAGQPPRPQQDSPQQQPQQQLGKPPSRQAQGTPPGLGASGAAAAAPEAAPAAAAAATKSGGFASKSGRLSTIPESNRAPSEGDDGDSDDGSSVKGGPGGRLVEGGVDGAARKRTGKMPAGGPAKGGRGGGDGGSGGDGAEDKWERGSEGGESSASGSQAASGITSVTDAQSGVDIMVDARRGRVLKAVRKVLMGPMLMAPLERLRLHTYGLLALVLVTHIVCYVVLTRVIRREHNGVYMVYRQAQAMDRAELLVVRVLIGTFCERANNTDRRSACTPPLSAHLLNMQASIQTLEQNHQGVYLGFDPAAVSRPDRRVYDLWTNRKYDYHVYMDTLPPQVLTEFAGVWQLGNRFIAASREALYWLPKLRDRFRWNRVYQFVVTNGLGSLFTGYATSLDLLMDAAWRSLALLRLNLIILMVVEVLVVQLLCLTYEWLLIHRVEEARLLGVVCMVGLPGPVLRQLSSKEVKVLDESDGEEDDDDDSLKEGENNNINNNNPTIAAAAAGAGGAEAADGGGGGGAADGAVRADGAGTNDGEKGVRAVRHLNSAKAGLGGSVTSGPLALYGGGGGGGGRAEGSGSGSGGGDGKGLAGKTYAPAPGASGMEEDDDLPLAGGVDAAGTAAAVRSHAGRSKRSRWRRPRAYGIQLVNGKALLTSKWREVRFMSLLVLWFAAVLAIYVVSILKLAGMQGALASLNMASHITYRYTRVRAVGFAFLTQDDATSRAVWRDLLANEVRLFRSEYEALMYGGMAISQVNSVFQHAVPASTFASASFANEFFRTKRCFRYNQTLCARPGTPYYEVTHNGLDVMVRRMMTEMELLISDADEDVKYNGTRWTYMYNVGTFDLYEGLQQASSLFVDYSISRYNSVITLHTILLIASFFVMALYVLFVLWPHLAKYKADAERQSALLSHVPPEVDTAGHVRATCRRARAVAQRGAPSGAGGVGPGQPAGAAVSESV